MFYLSQLVFVQFDYLITASADDGAQHIEAESFGLLEFNLRWDRQLFFRHHHVHQYRTVDGEGALQGFIDF